MTWIWALSQGMSSPLCQMWVVGWMGIAEGSVSRLEIRSIIARSVAWLSRRCLGAAGCVVCSGQSQNKAGLRMKIHLVCLRQGAYEAMLRLEQQAEPRRHTLVDDPASADMILFVGG